MAKLVHKDDFVTTLVTEEGEERLPCPFCGGNQWEFIDGEWWVGHDTTCPIAQARILLDEIIEPEEQIPECMKDITNLGGE